MLRKSFSKAVAVGEFKIGKIETGGHGAAGKGVAGRANRLAAKPGAGRHHYLWPVRCLLQAAKQVAGIVALWRYGVYVYRIAAVVVPAFIAFYTVKG